MDPGKAIMKAGIVLCHILLYFHHVMAQVIPENRQANWNDAILSYQYPIPMPEVSVVDFGATGNGMSDDQPAVMTAISSLNGSAGYVYFPPGNYKMLSPISLPDSVILKGHSSDVSVLHFDFNTSSLNCIDMTGSPASVLIQIDGGYLKDSNWVICDSAFLFSPGDFAEILQENGAWDDVPIEWAAHSVGQIIRVDHISGDTIFLENPLRITYEAQLNPRIRKISPRVYAGVECLKLKRLDQSVAGANILISYAANCRVRGVESDVSVAAHVDIFQSTGILVDGCYFHHAFAYDGVSKHGYGVTLNSHTGECLITNNIFRYLRHAMMVKTGANGNVFSYNYSREVHRNEIFSNYGGDISLHGHFPFANLFEGNIVQNIIIDHYWGPSGPHNTFFRNRAETYGIIFTDGNPTTSDYQHIVGNDVIYNGLFFVGGPYDITGTGHIEHGNNIDGTITPPNTNTLVDTSYYLEEEPVFWDITDDWPSLGIPHTLGTGSNPARNRWFSSGSKTVCPLYREWAGTVNTEWDDPHNWEPYGVPGEDCTVTVPAGSPNDPMVSGGSHRVRAVLIHDGSTIEVNGSGELIIKK